MSIVTTVLDKLGFVGGDKVEDHSLAVETRHWPSAVFGSEFRPGKGMGFTYAR